MKTLASRCLGPIDDRTPDARRDAEDLGREHAITTARIVELESMLRSAHVLPSSAPPIGAVTARGTKWHLDTRSLVQGPVRSGTEEFCARSAAAGTIPAGQMVRVVAYAPPRTVDVEPLDAPSLTKHPTPEL